MFRFFIVFLALVFVYSSGALAGGACGNRDDIIKRLETEYGEKKAADGRAITSQIMEIFVAQNGSYTVILTGEDGESCVASTGQNFRMKKPVYGVDI